MPVAQGDYADAERLFRRSLAIKRKALGTEHFRVATSLNNLALVLESQVINSFARNISMSHKCVKVPVRGRSGHFAEIRTREELVSQKHCIWWSVYVWKRS